MRATVCLLQLTPLELIDRIAALVPPPRTYRHRYFGVLAPNSPLRAAVTAMALTPPVPVQQAVAQTGQTGTEEGVPGVVPLGSAIQTRPEPVESAPPKRTGALPVGGADCPHLRSFPATVLDVWWADAHHRFYHAQYRYQANT